MSHAVQKNDVASNHEPAPLIELFKNEYLTFLDVIEAEARGELPQRILAAMDGFVKCGSLSEGFAFLSCAGCKQSQVAGFSCKKRGFCPKCAGRRATSHTIHLLDYVLPEAVFRQWVITFPQQVRYLMATRRTVMTTVNRIAEHEISLSYQRASRKNLGKSGQTGSISFIQMAGSALNLAPHAHVLFIDGVYVLDGDGKPKFRHFPPNETEIRKVLSRIVGKVTKWLVGQGLLEQCNYGDYPGFNIPENLAPRSIYELMAAASVQYRSFLGERKGKTIRRAGRTIPVSGKPTAAQGGALHQDGFSIHYTRTEDGRRRGQLEKLVSYMARPIVSEKNLEILEDGNIRHKLKSPWSDGTEEIIFDPIEMIERLALIVPHTWKNLVVYSGCFAPNANIRPLIVPNMVERRNSAGNRSWYIPWSELLAKTFKIDLFQCPNCDSKRRVLMVITNKETIAKMTKSLGLSSDPPYLKPSKFGHFDFEEMTVEYFG